MTSSTPAPLDFTPALIIVDLQEDFCPPNGALAVPGGRDIAPLINTLLTLPFVLKIATKDWHPSDHVSFASNHPPPNNLPFKSTFTLRNPAAEKDQTQAQTQAQSQTEEITLWPDHCIQNSKGAELIPELNASLIDAVIHKGTNPSTEMYSAFYDAFCNEESNSGLGRMLREKNVTHVFVVGLAFDYCVRWTAVRARREGFETFVLEEGTRAVNEGGWERVRGDLEGEGVRVVGVDGEAVDWVRGLR